MLCWERVPSAPEQHLSSGPCPGRCLSYAGAVPALSTASLLLGLLSCVPEPPQICLSPRAGLRIPWLPQTPVTVPVPALLFWPGAVGHPAPSPSAPRSPALTQQLLLPLPDRRGSPVFLGCCWNEIRPWKKCKAKIKAFVVIFSENYQGKLSAIFQSE